MPYQREPSVNEILSALPLSEYDRMSPLLTEVSLSLKEVLFHAGETFHHAYFFDDAVVSLLNVMRNGDMVEVGSIGREGMLGVQGVFGGDLANTSAIIQRGGRGWRMDVDSLQREFARGGVLHEVLLRHTFTLLNQITQAAACNRSHLLQGRFCRWILMLHDRLEGDRFLLTHEFLANMLGAPRSQVSLVAAKVQRKRWIEYSRGTMTVLSRADLESGACECYQVIKDTFDALRRFLKTRTH